MGSNLLPECKLFFKKIILKFILKKITKKVTRDFKYTTDFKKPNIPTKDEAPILGLKTNKNFIIANAVENILARNNFF